MLIQKPKRDYKLNTWKLKRFSNFKRWKAIIRNKESRLQEYKKSRTQISSKKSKAKINPRR